MEKTLVDMLLEKELEKASERMEAELKEVVERMEGKTGEEEIKIQEEILAEYEYSISQDLKNYRQIRFYRLADNVEKQYRRMTIEVVDRVITRYKQDNITEKEKAYTVDEDTMLDILEMMQKSAGLSYLSN